MRNSGDNTWRPKRRSAATPRPSRVKRAYPLIRLPGDAAISKQGICTGREIASGQKAPVQNVSALSTRHLLVHPLSCCSIWHDGDPGAAHGAVSPSAAPQEGVLVRVPV